MSRPAGILKDGYWDRTSIVRSSDGALRVRKESKGTAAPGPWSRQALRNEIAYLRSLPEAVHSFFPPLLDSWDGDTPGYEIPYYPERRDVAQLLLTGALDEADTVAIQDTLVQAILYGLHAERGGDELSFVMHLEDILDESVTEIAGMGAFQEIAESPTIVINGDSPVPGLRKALGAVRRTGLLNRLAGEPSVRLHGDLILENILWPGPILIDPVSVTGLTHGPALFDLVKYESYASGELYAIREELVEAGPSAAGGYHYGIRWSGEKLQPFTRLDLTTRFRAQYLRVHGPVDQRLYHLIDAYFSLVMARNTTGRHQFARILKATQCLAGASGESS